MSERRLCSACGKPAACGCNAPYVSKLEYAKAHMKPDKSDRMNGKELGVTHDTIRRARKQLDDNRPVGAKRKGQDDKLRRLPKKKNGTSRPTGRPRTDAYYSMKTANRLRGKARSAFMEEWAIWREKQFREQNPDVKWLHSLDETLRRFIALDKELREGDNWRKYEVTPCIFGLVPQCIEIMNRWVSMFQPKIEENRNVVHH